MKMSQRRTSEYRKQFLTKSLLKHLPIYHDNVAYRIDRREREHMHTPIIWDSSDSDTESSSDSIKLSPCKQVPMSHNLQESKGTQIPSSESIHGQSVALKDESVKRVNKKNRRLQTDVQDSEVRKENMQHHSTNVERSAVNSKDRIDKQSNRLEHKNVRKMASQYTGSHDDYSDYLYDKSKYEIYNKLDSVPPGDDREPYVKQKYTKDVKLNELQLWKPQEADASQRHSVQDDPKRQSQQVNGRDYNDVIKRVTNRAGRTFKKQSRHPNICSSTPQFTGTTHRSLQEHYPSYANGICTRVRRPRRPDRVSLVQAARPHSAPVASNDQFKHPSESKVNKAAAAEKPVFLPFGWADSKKDVGLKKTHNVRAASAVYPRALRAKCGRNLPKHRRTKSPISPRCHKSVDEEQLQRETSSWHSEYHDQYPAYDLSAYLRNLSLRSPRHVSRLYD